MDRKIHTYKEADYPIGLDPRAKQVGRGTIRLLVVIGKNMDRLRNRIRREY